MLGFDLRNTFCTRFLFTVVPAELYWGDTTLYKLNAAFAEDLCRLFTTGIQAARPNSLEYMQLTECMQYACT